MQHIYKAVLLGIFMVQGCLGNELVLVADPGALKISIEESAFKESTIYVYNDDGVAKDSITNLKNALKHLNHSYTIEDIDAVHVIEGKWKENAIAFIMPGGADLPYCKKLNGLGNNHIREYVEEGGIYIGFCAGAYYGAGYCDFHRGDQKRGYEVLGPRELRFFKGAAVGPTLAHYIYASHLGSRIAEIEWIEGSLKGASYNVYFNGGCHFPEADHDKNITVLARYKNKGATGLPAIIECGVGRGKALLSGVHPEYSMEDLEGAVEDKTSSDYQHLKKSIFPKLRDRSHRRLFEKIMDYIKDGKPGNTTLDQ